MRRQNLSLSFPLRCCLWWLVLFYSVSLSQCQEQDCPAATNEEVPLRGLARLLGSSQAAHNFIVEQIWGEKPHAHLYKGTNSDVSSDSSLLWSKALAKKYIQQSEITKEATLNSNNNATTTTTVKPFVYREDISVVKNGSPKQDFSQPHASWSEIDGFLEKDGYSIVMNELENWHNPILNLLVDLEEQLVGVFISANSYLTASGNTGFDPHWDAHDILVLQLEGSKTWTICEQRTVDLYKHGQQRGGGIFPAHLYDNLGNCTDYLFEPGDVFYAPMGTIHSAKATQDDQYSMHLTLSLNRNHFSHGNLLQELAKRKTNSFSASISAITSKSTALQRLLPREQLQSIASSFDNGDLPPDFLTQLYQSSRALIQTEFVSDPYTKDFLWHAPQPPFEDMIVNMRFLLVTMRKRRPPLPKGQCYDNNGNDVSVSSLLDNHHTDQLFEELEFRRRLPSSRVLVVALPDQYLLVQGKTSEEYFFPLEWKAGIEFAIGAHTGSKGQYFTVHDLVQTTSSSSDDAVSIIQELLAICVLEYRSRRQGHEGGEASCSAA